MIKLYKENDFRDNCGFGLIASIDGVQSRKIVQDSIDALESMTHRGGIGSDGKTGDGCGLLVDINSDFYIKTLQKDQKIKLQNRFAIGQLFYFQSINKLIPQLVNILSNEGLTLVTQ
jgi:glutamate synthase (NADPH/NADH) large chain